MNQVLTDWLWPGTRETITLAELSQRCGISEAELAELVGYCALVPLTSSPGEVAFSAHWVTPLRHAARLRLDFDLDLFTVAVLLDHLNRIDELERRVHALQAVLPASLQASKGFA